MGWGYKGAHGEEMQGVGQGLPLAPTYNHGAGAAAPKTCSPLSPQLHAHARARTHWITKEVKELSVPHPPATPMAIMGTTLECRR